MILKFKYLIFLIFIVITIICSLLIPKVNINYDASIYLPNQMQTRKAIEVNNEEFGVSSYTYVMVTNISSEESNQIYNNLLTISEVNNIEYNSKSELYYKDNSALYLVIFDSDSYDQKTKLAVEDIKLKLDNYEYHLKGEAITSLEYNRVIEKEIITIILILIPIVLAVLFLTTTSWIEPIIFIFVVLVSIVINMGTNVFFDSISYMTHSTSGVLQLAICMDYVVIILHSYRRYQTEYTKDKAIKMAMKTSFVPVLGSALTTFFGFVALMTMKYKIGFDIGSVLAKGTIISILCAFLLMPGLIYVLDPLLNKTKHKSFLKRNIITHKFLFKSKYIIPFVAILIISISFFIQRTNKYVYSETSFASESKQLSKSIEKIETTFGNKNIFTILIRNDQEDNEINILKNIRSLVSNENIELHSIASSSQFYTKLNETEFKEFLLYNKIDEEAANQMMLIFNIMKYQSSQENFSIIDYISFIENTTLLSTEQKDMFKPMFENINKALSSLSSNNYNRIILTIDLPLESDKTFSFITKLNEILDEDNQDYYILGESVAIYDIKEVVQKDNNRTNTLMIIFIAIIILIIFRSLVIPIILILLIEGAIWINMAYPALNNSNLLFIGYIIVSCIMLGATIDYAILYTNRYINNRKTLSKKEAMISSFEESKTTVLTSGLILIVAGFTLNFVSSIPSIAVFGSLIGRGGIASLSLVLFVLPSLLYVFDKLIQKTTLKNRIE